MGWSARRRRPRTRHDETPLPGLRRCHERRRSRSRLSGAQAHCSSDEIGLIDHAAGLATGDADEDALVQPVEIGGGRLDLGRGAEGVLTGVDVLTAGETCEDIRAAVAHTARLDIEQIPAGGLQRVADVAKRGAVRERDLPVGAGAGEELPVEVRPRERPTGQRDDAAVPLSDIAKIKGLAEPGLQAVDQGEAGIGKSRRLEVGAAQGVLRSPARAIPAGTPATAISSWSAFRAAT
jgi:hypothetical protein